MLPLRMWLVWDKDCLQAACRGEEPRAWSSSSGVSWVCAAAAAAAAAGFKYNRSRCCGCSMVCGTAECGCRVRAGFGGRGEGYTAAPYQCKLSISQHLRAQRFRERIADSDACHDRGAPLFS